MRLPLCLFSVLQLVAFDRAGASSIPTYNADLDHGAHGSYPVRKFISSRLTAPQTNFVRWTPECDDGRLYLITPRGWKVSRPGPMILDSAGELIWSSHYANEYGGQAYDLRVQQYKGDDYLTFWLGDDTVRGHGAGHFYMLNATYEAVHKVSAANGMLADLHEFTITPEGTALVIVFQAIPTDTRPAGRKFNDLWNQAIWDCSFQEVDIETGKLVFEWRASEHINITETYIELGPGNDGTQDSPFDPFHLNSVQKDKHGNYLISARNLHALLYIDGETGNIIWNLGGKGNRFMDLSDGYALNFAWQHDARFATADAFPKTYTAAQHESGISTQLITIFDNAAVDWNYVYGLPYSRGLLLEVAYPTAAASKREAPLPIDATSVSAKTAHAALSKLDAEKVASINGIDSSYSVRLIREFVNPKHVRSSTQGSLQVVPARQGGVESTVLLGYGLNAVVSEFSSNGTVLCDMHFGAATSWEKGNVQSYRAYKAHWVGRPREPPAVALNRGQVLVSWNGATEVRSWLLQVSSAGTDTGWRNVTLSRKDGFETAMVIPREYRDLQYVRVLGLDGEGRACENGVSEVYYRGYLSAKFRQHSANGTVSSTGLLLLLSGTAACCLVLYRLCLRRSFWRHGRPAFCKRGVA